jgi:16S rRNA (cytosine1402-N4)-methyltransferase
VIVSAAQSRGDYEISFNKVANRQPASSGLAPPRSAETSYNHFMSDEPQKEKKKYRPYWRKKYRRSTRAGEHRPVLLAEVLAALAPKPGQVVADCTLGFAGHALELLQTIAPDGLLIACDLDPANLEPARAKLDSAGGLFALHHANFAAVQEILAMEGAAGVDGLLADLGMSSMQVDDRDRGFSFMRDGPLDMRMDPTRGRTAADLVNTLSSEELAACFRELGDEPQAEEIAELIVNRRSERTWERSQDLRAAIEAATAVIIDRTPGAPSERKQKLGPVARVFQALRILVNRELANLQQLLRVLPQVLKPGGTAAIISFHSGEDRLIKASFRDGLRTGVYEAIADDPIRPTLDERRANPRSRSAKLRWARRPPAQSG